MTDQSIHILPYTSLVGQEDLKLALELAFIAPKIGGVLLSGHRGTGKSTAVRAFANMAYNRLPVTLPINATEDRVVGGWQIEDLIQGKATPKQGLLEDANGTLLFIDEVNLLDDHIVNIILDVSATGVLVVQREGLAPEPQMISYTLVGTMNPEEGGLRPQLLDRFGLVVSVKAETDDDKRVQILNTVLNFDRAIRDLKRGKENEWLAQARQADVEHRAKLEQARSRFDKVQLPDDVAKACIQITNAKEFNTEGHRGDYVMALAACARAALNGEETTSQKHLLAVAKLALQHRRTGVMQRGQELWTTVDDQRLSEILPNA